MDLVTYWQQNGQTGLMPIIQRHLAPMITDTLDKAARIAWFTNPFSIYGDTSGTDFSSIGNTDKITTALIDQLWLEIRERDYFYNSLPTEDNTQEIFCLTTDGVIKDLKSESNANGDTWQDVMTYANPQQRVTGEIGKWRGVRFVTSRLACLYNAGTVTQQHSITAAVKSGEGAPDPKTTKVRSVYRMGQPNRNGIKYYIQLDDVTGLAKGQRVTIHVKRTADFGITDGLDWRDGYAVERRIFSVDAVNKRITLEKPIMRDFDTDLGGGVYGYVTFGTNIHSALFVKGNNGIAMGTARAPRIKTPPPVDDAMAMFRFTWNCRMGYELLTPEAFIPVFLYGSNAR